MKSYTFRGLLGHSHTFSLPVPSGVSSVRLRKGETVLSTNEVVSGKAVITIPGSHVTDLGDNRFIVDYLNDSSVYTILSEIVALADPVPVTTDPTKPTYLTSKLDNPLDSLRGVYNWKPSNTRKIRGGLAKARSGNKFHILTVGDSIGIGFNGVTTVESSSFPRAMVSSLQLLTGIGNSGTGIVPALAAAGTRSTGWVKVGPVDDNVYPSYATMAAGSALTYTSTIAGTAIEIYWNGLSSNFTYQIDGAAAVSVTSPGTDTMHRTVVSGLSNAVHTIRINAPTSWVFLVGAAVVADTGGITSHNISYGGARANHGINAVNWSNTTNAGIRRVRKGAFDLQGITPDLVICQLGSNDMYNGDTVGNAIQGIRNIKNWYPTADFVMTQAWQVPGTDINKFNSYLDAKYKLADELDTPLIDLYYRTGPAATAQANGWIGVDNIHPSTGGNLEIGRILASLIAS